MKTLEKIKGYYKSSKHPPINSKNIHFMYNYVDIPAGLISNQTHLT